MNWFNLAANIIDVIFDISVIAFILYKCKD